MLGIDERAQRVALGEEPGPDRNRMRHGVRTVTMHADRLNGNVTGQGVRLIGDRLRVGMHGPRLVSRHQCAIGAVGTIGKPLADHPQTVRLGFRNHWSGRSQHEHRRIEERHCGGHRTCLIDVAIHAVIQRAVGLDIAQPGAGDPTQTVERAQLIEHVGGEVVGLDIHPPSPESDEVRIADMRANDNATLRCRVHRATNGRRIAGVKTACNVRTRDDVEHGQVVAHRPVPIGLAKVRVEIDDAHHVTILSRVHQVCARPTPLGDHRRVGVLGSLIVLFRHPSSLRRLTPLLLGGVCAVFVSAVPSPLFAERKAPTGKDGKAKVTGTIAPRANVQLTATEFARTEQPIGVVSRSGDPTLYVIEKPGRIRAYRNGAFEPTAVVDIASRVDSTNERGLLGLAFSPKARDVLYIDYTDKRGVVHVSEIPFDGSNADISRERVLMMIPKPFNEHNAGTLSFDRDGLLYIAIGDGGSSGDPKANAQRTDVLLGKILRIDPKPSANMPYSIPPSNPFARPGAPTLGTTKTAKAKPEIIAFGLRNPWRAEVDADTGDVWVPEVGEANAEEINRIPAGSTTAPNFGWNLREGRQSFKGPRPKNSVDPVFDYPHADGRCAIVGGVVYRGNAVPALKGRYIFGDVCSGAIQVLDGTTSGQGRATDLGARVSYLTSFGVDPDGELIATSLEGGLYRLTAAAK